MKSLFSTLLSLPVVVGFGCRARKSPRSGTAGLIPITLLVVLNALIAQDVSALTAESQLAPAVCQAGTLDTAFNGTGIVTTPIGTGADQGFGMAMQTDGKIVVVGDSFGANFDFAVVRYNSDGSLDTSFNGTGKVTTPVGSSSDAAFSVAIQTDGKIVVAGDSFNGLNFDFAVVRYNSDGSLDNSFNGTGKVITPIGSGSDVGLSVAVQSDGKIVVAGHSNNGANDDFAVVRYNSDGTLDTSFNGTGKVTTPIGSSTDQGQSVAIQTDGKIAVAGYSNNGANDDFAVVRYNSDGTLDTAFNGTGKVTTPIGSSTDQGYSVALQSDGKIVVAGESLGTNLDVAVVRYNSDGTLDTSFNGTGIVTTSIGVGTDVGYSVAIQVDGKIVVGGISVGSNLDFAAVRYKSDGSLDTSFNGTGKVTTPIGSGVDQGRSAAVQSDGKIVVAGYANNGSNDDVAVVRYVGVCVRVSVTATPTQVTEGDTATYRVRASPAVPQDTIVTYSMSGTATLGSDYTLSPSGGQATIPAGKTSVKVRLKAKTDALIEGSETAIMTLQPGSGYELGNPSAATVTIMD